MPKAKKPLAAPTSAGPTVGDLVSKVSQMKASQLLYVVLLVAFLAIGYLLARLQMLESGNVSSRQTVVPTQGAAAPAKSITEADIKSWAKELGINENTFASCFDSSSNQASIDRDSQDGAAAGTSGTPTFYINGVQLVGARPFADFKAEIDAAIAGNQTGTSVTVDVGHLPALGKQNAPVTMIEFTDLECPFCRSFFTTTFPQIKRDYIDTGKVKFYFRHFPLDFHPLAKPFANAVECANEQGKFWELHDKIYNEQG